nr:MAG TPA: hypothetical protein [Caudoviricetes sp.]
MITGTNNKKVCIIEKRGIFPSFLFLKKFVNIFTKNLDEQCL